MEEKGEFHEGDSVKMHGQACIGEIVRVTDKYATVVFKSMEIKVSLRQLEKTLPCTEARPSTLPIQPTTRTLNLDADAFFSFNPEIDLHGMSVHEALSALDRWIDRASLLGHRQLKIIHGKGQGTLRNAIRTHLQSHDQVERVIDRHSYPGGTGVTGLEIV